MSCTQSPTPPNTHDQGLTQDLINIYGFYFSMEWLSLLSFLRGVQAVVVVCMSRHCHIHNPLPHSHMHPPNAHGHRINTEGSHSHCMWSLFQHGTADSSSCSERHTGSCSSMYGGSGHCHVHMPLPHSHTMHPPNAHGHRINPGSHPHGKTFHKDVFQSHSHLPTSGSF